ncbi:MAG: hypothetical protein LBH75_07545 [Treponema sp.]|jgi:hypothetical protein|nr:hypothetical protein [Treponema sp.]
MIEFIGYLASILVAISITIKGGFYFRIFNLSGSICFFIYGLFINSWPVAIINLYGTGINIFYILKEKIKNHKKLK